VTVVFVCIICPVVLTVLRLIVGCVARKRPHANILTISANRQLAIVLYLLTMRALQHFIGCVGVAITLDYLAFNGFCTDVCTRALSLACDQMLSQVQQFKTFL